MKILVRFWQVGKIKIFSYMIRIENYRCTLKVNGKALPVHSFKFDEWFNCPFSDESVRRSWKENSFTNSFHAIVFLISTLCECSS